MDISIISTIINLFFFPHIDRTRGRPPNTASSPGSDVPTYFKPPTVSFSVFHVLKEQAVSSRIPLCPPGLESRPLVLCQSRKFCQKLQPELNSVSLLISTCDGRREGRDRCLSYLWRPDRTFLEVSRLLFSCFPFRVRAVALCHLISKYVLFCVPFVFLSFSHSPSNAYPF